MEHFMIILLICSVTMSVLSLAYMVAIPYLSRRYSEKWCYYAWLIIIVGLIIPFRPQWGNGFVKIEVPSNATTTVAQINGEDILHLSMPIILPPIENIVISETPTLFQISWWQVSAAIWLAGLIIFIVYHSIKHYCFVKMVRRWSKDIKDEHILSVLKNLTSEMGISKRIPIYLCSCVGSPMMIGLIKPQIFLPTVEPLHDELYFILKHELIHYRRKDLLYKYLILGATALHWFNPVVYLIAKTVNVLCEISCDTEVLKGANMDTRHFYGETIISIVKYQSRMKTALSTTFYGGKNSMNKRISSIIDKRKKKAGVIIIALVLISAIGTGFVIAATPTQTNNLSYKGLESAQQADSFTPAQQTEEYNDMSELIQHGPRHFTGSNASSKAIEVDGLIGVVEIGQNTGWVYARELNLFWDIEPTNFDEHVAYMQMINDYIKENGNLYYVNVYDFDGETVIDKMAVELGSPPNVSNSISSDDSDISSPSEYKSPYRIAKSLEEVRSIWDLKDGTIPVTSIEIPEIINRQADGIIITRQDLNEAIAIMDEYNRINGESNMITHLVTTRLLQSLTPDELEFAIIVGFVHDIAEAAIDAGLNPEGVEIFSSRSFSISSDETRELLREEAQRLLSLHGEPTPGLALEAAHRLFGN